MDKLDTTNACCFYETFMNCRSLKVLDMSNFNTQNLRDSFKHINGDTPKGFQSTFSGVTGLEKLILGKNFSRNGNGATTVAAALPNPAPIDGQATKWYNAANDTYYDASEIPEPNGETVIYIAAVPPVNP
jgi:surface protein